MAITRMAVLFPRRVIMGPWMMRRATCALFSTQEAPMRLGMESLNTSMSEPVRRVLSLDNAARKEVTQARISRAIEAFQERPGDTGSSAVQIAVLTVRIESTREHISQHRKDNSTKRGLDALVTKRRKLLKYMKRTDFDGYRRVINALKLEPLSDKRR
mmetsp:Transcript_35309/g.79671  ORF Transcript_35309/g.79671 Transcript_35309/m.79671 type:complete len:158 (+) Transcript_35309:52-525(+)